MKSFLKQLPLSPATDPIILGDFDGYRLAAPVSFWSADGTIKAEIINGCGPAGIGDALVPDTAYFLSLKPACKIHDWMFTVYNDDAGFKLSNKVFLDNMERINKSATRFRWLRWLRSMRIRKYFRAVRNFGRLFYYDANEHLYDSAAVYA